jgi:hypothetical protein
MANNPVQVVLNSRDFLIVPEKLKSGGNKDFYADRDNEFIEHRNSLQQKVSAIRSSFQRSGKSAGFVKVTMRKEAWAKSHRPHTILFPETKTVCVGASDLGELFYMVTEPQLARIVSDIGRAEDKTRWKVNEKTQKRKAAPSHRRSEVGAIESIDVPLVSEKRRFTAEQALSWFNDQRTGGLYLIEIFAPEMGLFSADRSYLDQAMRLLAESVKSSGLHAELLTLKFRNDELASAHVFGARLLSGDDRHALEKSVLQHQRFLRLLDGIDPIRRVLLPPILVPSRSNATPADSSLFPHRPSDLPQKLDGRSYSRVAVIDGGISEFYDPWVIGRHDLLAKEHRCVELSSWQKCVDLMNFCLKGGR